MVGCRIWQVGFLVTGGRSPIALSIAEFLGRAGQPVTLVTRRIDNDILSSTERFRDLSLLECDLGSDFGQKQVVKTCLTMKDFAGAVFCHRFRGQENVLDHFALEVEGPASIISSIAKEGSGEALSFVFITSPAARAYVSSEPLAYHLAKSGINSAVRYLAGKLGNQGIRVNAVSPGGIVVKERSRDFFMKNPLKVKWAVTAAPLGRLLEPEEVAKVVHFLLLDSSSFMTGQILELDGGLSVRDLATFGEEWLD
jgi:3-oxoacyl-[acyl-carrier protein] reductase